MMPSPASESRLREAYETLLSQRDPRDHVACPSPDAIVALVERRVSEAARLETLDHVMACVKCRRDLDLLRTAAAAARASGGTDRHTSFTSSRAYAIAATLLVALGLALYSRRPADEGVLRGSSEGAIHPLVRLNGAAGATVSWRPVATARRYELTISDTAGRALATQMLADTAFVLADSVAAGVPAVIVTVSAELADGSTTAPVSARLALPKP